MNPWIDPSSTSLTWPNRTLSVLRPRRSVEPGDGRRRIAAAEPGGVEHRDAGGEVDLAGHREEAVDGVVARDRATAEVGEGGDADTPGEASESTEGVGGAHRREEAQHRLAGERHRRGFPELADRVAVGVLGHALDSGVGVDAGSPHEGGVDRGEVEAGVDHEDRPRRRHPVEVGGDEPLAGEVDGVEAPGQERLVGVGDLGVESGEPVEHVGDRAAPGPVAAVGVGPGEVADVGELPHGALEGVRVGLDEAGEQDPVGEPAVDAAVVGRGQPVGVADREHATVAHGDGGCGRRRRVQRVDDPGRVDRGGRHEGAP